MAGAEACTGNGRVNTSNSVDQFKLVRYRLSFSARFRTEVPLLREQTLYPLGYGGPTHKQV